MKPKGKASNYKSAPNREKELRLALYRIQTGRAHTGATKVTIAAVAREAGVSTALIHNYYPEIAETVRAAQGRSRLLKDVVKHQALASELKKSAAYRLEIAELRAKVANLASLNEVLLDENRLLRAEIDDPKVVDLASRRPHGEC